METIASVLQSVLSRHRIPSVAMDAMSDHFVLAHRAAGLKAIEEAVAHLPFPVTIIDNYSENYVLVGVNYVSTKI
jgi:hypothetical protein